MRGWAKVETKPNDQGDQQQKPVDPFEHLEREAAKVPNPVTLTYDRAALYERAAAVPDPEQLAARNRQIRLPDHVLRL
jgi:hypothetical protein